MKDTKYNIKEAQPIQGEINIFKKPYISTSIWDCRLPKTKKKILKLAAEQRQNFIKKKKCLGWWLTMQDQKWSQEGHNEIVFSINVQKICYPRILSSTDWFFFKNEGKIHAFSDKERMRVSSKEPFNEPSNGCTSESKSVM